jgi:hypothetical protein
MGFNAGSEPPQRHTVDPLWSDLAAWHSEMPSQSGDHLVDVAYDQLTRQTDRLFRALTMEGNPCRFDVRFSHTERPYQSDRELISAVLSERQLEVVVAASDKYRLHPLVDCRPGGAYDRFRAVHDILGHALAGRGFDAEGECAAWHCQDRYYRGLARLALLAELRAEHAVLAETGAFSEHKAAIPPPPLARRILHPGAVEHATVERGRQNSLAT